jgi:hypothetical protein
MRINAQSGLSPRAGRGDYLWLLLAVAFPAVFINIGHGQNGFLTAALIGARWSCSTAGRSSPACCSACSPTSRNAG